MHNRLAILIAALLVSTPALAWHESGHQLTARIAFEQLPQQRQLEIFEIIKHHPRFDEDFLSLMPAEIVDGTELDRARWAFEQASIWPDLMRDVDEQSRTHFHRSRWHYINLPVWMAPDDKEAMDGRLEHNMGRSFSPPMRQNLNAVQALRGNLAIWRDSNASDAEKAIAFCWILHITGDIHQPLHTVALFSQSFFPKGDRGGNRIEVIQEPDYSNLHAVWDGLPTDLPDLTPSDRTRKVIESDVVNDAAIDAWVNSHAELAVRFVYPEEVKGQLVARLSNQQSPSVELSTEYLVVARAVARRQVNLAGHRIASLIE